MDHVYQDGYRLAKNEVDGKIQLYLIRIVNGVGDEDFGAKMLYEADDAAPNFVERDRILVLAQGYVDFLNLGGCPVLDPLVQPLYDLFHGLLVPPVAVPPMALPEGYSLYAILNPCDYIIQTPDDTFVRIKQDESLEELTLEDLAQLDAFCDDLESWQMPGDDDEEEACEEGGSD